MNAPDRYVVGPIARIFFVSLDVAKAREGNLVSENE
jgi:hypothetical protein